MKKTLSFFIVIFFLACQNTVQEDIGESVVSAQDSSYNKHSYYDAIADLLAGNQPLDSFWVSVYQSKSWQSYKEGTKRNWGIIRSEKFNIIREWVNQEIGFFKSQLIGGNCFYPFAGADALHVLLFFPYCKNYFLVGLEPVGTLPALERLSEQELAEYFTAIEKSMYHLLNLSFFRTLSMQVDLSGQRAKSLDGTLHLLLVFLKQLQNEILEITFLQPNLAGEWIPIVADSSQLTAKAVRIGFRHKQAATNNVQYLYYFSADLSDNQFHAGHPLYKWLLDQGFTATLVKSASYLMHKPYFSQVRQLILDHTSIVLQDDSGIPYRFFADNSWQVQLYGSYTRPIPLFKDWYQKDLYKAYHEYGQVKPLPFGIGYKYRRGESSLMLCWRQGLL